jgi:hypothetical protein
MCHLFNVHAALRARDEHGTVVSTVEKDGQVQLAIEVNALMDKNLKKKSNIHQQLRDNKKEQKERKRVRNSLNRTGFVSKMRRNVRKCRSGSVLLRGCCVC